MSAGCGQYVVQMSGSDTEFPMWLDETLSTAHGLRDSA